LAALLATRSLFLKVVDVSAKWRTWLSMPPEVKKSEQFCWLVQLIQSFQIDFYCGETLVMKKGTLVETENPT